MSNIIPFPVSKHNQLNPQCTCWACADTRRQNYYAQSDSPVNDVLSALIESGILRSNGI